MPEVALVAILDADKEGFLRSTTSLVQTAGRSARHVNGRVILYADKVTDAIKELLEITAYHRAKQIEYNQKHKITPKSVKRAINESAYLFDKHKTIDTSKPVYEASGENIIAELTRDMLEAADKLEFERAAFLRDQIKQLKGKKKR